MVEMTLQISDSLADKIRPIGDWLPTIIELSVANFDSPLVKKASDDLIAFLSDNPTPQKTLEYKIAEGSQQRVTELLEVNREGVVKPDELAELDEWEQFNNICAMLSARALKLAR